ncbi:hypothetical protein RND71_009777 [Anisodus tanguticus]|uniref:Non-reducing end beta-L-arabinofuranosidase-like GH127 catalytic domain-containing protein n=1 Tax=Anisodus tanguticus TaxID=243964 RepID=A0AAE1SIE3_9SOLA|nr:hypothetical protein RND71_009777 [Anisodus tanguticus]
MKSLVLFKLLGQLVFSVLYGGVVAIDNKECINALSSHTLRYELMSSHNETLKQEIFSHYHLTPTDESAWSNLLPRKVLREEQKFDWEMMYRKIKNYGGLTEIDGILSEVSLHDVRLEPNSMYGVAQQTNLEYLLMFDVDRLVWSFRKTAGLDTPASSHNDSLGEKMYAVVSALFAFQEKNDTGYLSAFPSDYFDRLEALQPVWAPYYTIHKVDVLPASILASY